MTSRRVVFLLAAGIIIIAFAIWLSSRRHLDRATLAGDLVLPGLETALNNVTEVRLTKGDETHTTLKKSAADWVVGERDYPADSGKVRKLLLDLGALNVVEEKTHNPANYPQLGVEDPTSPKASGTRVAVVTPAKVFEVIVGKPSSGKSGFVRVPATEKALLAAPSLTVDADPKRWLDHTLIDIPQDRVKSIDEKPAEGPSYTASREKKEQTDFTVSNIPKGRELTSPVAADSIAGALGGMMLDDVRKAGTGAAAAAAGAAPTGAGATPAGPGPTPAGPGPTPAAAGASAGGKKLSHAVFHTFDGLDIDIAGRKDESHDLIAITAHSTAKETAAEAQKLTTQFQGWEYEIPSYKYDAIFTSMDGLLKPVEKPEKKGKGAAGAPGADGAAGPGPGGPTGLPGSGAHKAPTGAKSSPVPKKAPPSSPASGGPGD